MGVRCFWGKMGHAVVSASRFCGFLPFPAIIADFSPVGNENLDAKTRTGGTYKTIPREKRVDKREKLW